MSTIASALDRAARFEGDGRGRFEADAALSSWPGIVHGGGLVAALDEAARQLGVGVGAGARRIEARLTASVPVATALALEGHARDGAATATVLDGGQPLAMATVTPLEARAAPDVASAWRGDHPGLALPSSETCLACGAGNPLGLRATLSFDDEGVSVRLVPREDWRVAGALHPALAPVALDEVAWWLGALVMKEGGLTNRIAVDLLDPRATVAGEVVAAGRFADVTPVDRRRTFWRTVVRLDAENGRPLARAVIVFRGGAEYSARQLDYLRARTPSDVFRRMFPGYARV